MRKTSGKNRLRENVLLSDMAAEGKCVARIDEKVYFISGGVPGDRVDILVEKDKKSYAEGRVYRLLEPSPDRINPFCRHFGTCGGCKWQNLSYERQLELKTRQVKDAFERIGKISGGTWHKIIPSEDIRYYRNKLEFTFSNQRWLENRDMNADQRGSLNGLGFHIPGRFDKILDIEECHLQAEPSNHIRRWVKSYAENHNLPFFDLREQTGLLRNLMIRTTLGGEVMVLLILTEYNEDIRNLLKELCREFPELSSVQYLINKKRNDSYSEIKAEIFNGKPQVEEKMGKLRFRIGPTSFFQTNPKQAWRLYQKVLEFANPQKESIVYDLYSGTGTIAQFIAENAKEVLGIEYVKAAVLDAKENAEMNNVNNVKFIGGDIAGILNEELVRLHGKPDVLITDPPRAGMHPDVIESILQIKPKRIVYVSCNPATQARDISLFLKDYEVIDIQPFDMFPHTHHVENIVLLKTI